MDRTSLFVKFCNTDKFSAGLTVTEILAEIQEKSKNHTNYQNSQILSLDWNICV